ncbi:uncharacterized protein GJ701_016563 isoform 1-T1 [Geothlypis trichas]
MASINLLKCRLSFPAVLCGPLQNLIHRFCLLSKNPSFNNLETLKPMDLPHDVDKVCKQGRGEKACSSVHSAPCPGDGGVGKPRAGEAANERRRCCTAREPRTESRGCGTGHKAPGGQLDYFIRMDSGRYLTIAEPLCECNFPIPSPEDAPLLGHKEASNALTRHKVCSIKRMPCTFEWLQEAVTLGEH